MKFTSGIKRVVKRHKLLHRVATTVREAIIRTKELTPYRMRSYRDFGFHGDVVLRTLVNEIFKNFRISSFIETGTHKATTTVFVAKLIEQLPIYTCEINKKYFAESRYRLKNYEKVELFRQSSDLFLKDLMCTKKNNESLNFPLIFLDAHWEDYMPLRAELREIGEFSRAIIIVDDVMVPDRRDLGYAQFSEGGKKQDLTIDYIKNSLNNKNAYRFFFPYYGENEAYREGPHDNDFRGYAILFQNIAVNEPTPFLEQSFFKAHFREFNVPGNKGKEQKNGQKD